MPAIPPAAIASASPIVAQAGPAPRPRRGGWRSPPTCATSHAGEATRAALAHVAMVVMFSSSASRSIAAPVSLPGHGASSTSRGRSSGRRPVGKRPMTAASSKGQSSASSPLTAEQGRRDTASARMRTGRSASIYHRSYGQANNAIVLRPPLVRPSAREGQFMLQQPRS